MPTVVLVLVQMPRATLASSTAVSVFCPSPIICTCWTRRNCAGGYVNANCPAVASTDVPKNCPTFATRGGCCHRSQSWAVCIGSARKNCSNLFCRVKTTKRVALAIERATCPTFFTHCLVWAHCHCSLMIAWSPSIQLIVCHSTSSTVWDWSHNCCEWPTKKYSCLFLLARSIFDSVRCIFFLFATMRQLLLDFYWNINFGIHGDDLCFIRNFVFNIHVFVHNFFQYHWRSEYESDPIWTTGGHCGTAIPTHTIRSNGVAVKFENSKYERNSTRCIQHSIHQFKMLSRKLITGILQIRCNYTYARINGITDKRLGESLTVKV